MQKQSLALPNGSLEKETLELLALIGLRIKREHPKQQRIFLKDDPWIAEICFMRPQHVPRLVGKYDNYAAGICGWDWVQEKFPVDGYELSRYIQHPRQALRLGYGKVKVVLAGVWNGKEQSITDIRARSTILSEYPNFTTGWFKQREKEVWVSASHGSTEGHIGRDCNYGVCVTATGESLRANQLRIIETLFESEAVLLISPWAWNAAESREVLERLIEALEEASDGRKVSRTQLPR